MRIKTGTAITVAAFVGLACFGIGMAGVKNTEKTYLAKEAALPESAISTYFDHINQHDYDVIYQESLIVDQHMNSQEDYVNELEKVYDGISTNDIEYTGLNNTDGSMEYRLYYQGKYLAKLKLIQASDGKWLASTIFNGDLTYEIEVPSGLKISINGIELDDSYLLGQEVIATNFSGMTQTTDAPRVDVYEVQNLLGEPEIQVVGESGYDTVKDVLTNRLLVGKVADSSLSSTLIDYAKTCAMFPAQETSVNNVLAISYRNSEWYSRISGMQNYWFTSHNTSSFSNEQVLSMVQQSDDTVVGHVIFDYYASNGEVSRTWNVGYQMTLINVNGTWQICGMAINNELNPTKLAWFEALNE